MSDTPLPGATVATVANPYNDPVTVAYSKLDSVTERAEMVDGEALRLADKLRRAQADVEAAKGYITASKERKKALLAEVDAARAELDAARDRYPDVAVAVDARRATTQSQRVAELQAELARIKKG